MHTQKFIVGGGRDICFWRSANNEQGAQNCAGIGSVDLFWGGIDVGGGLNCAKVYSYDLFLRSNVHSAKYGQMHAADTMIAANNHVPQFPKGGGEDDFWRIITEIDILLFIWGASIASHVAVSKSDVVLHCFDFCTLINLSFLRFFYNFD